jgi:hypothetical protein
MARQTVARLGPAHGYAIAALEQASGGLLRLNQT